MSNPTDRRYARTHEWAKLDGDVVTVGITAFAVEQLTEPTYLELPKVGKEFATGDEFGIIESVKSTSPIYAPVAGTVVERNETLTADLSPVNDDPFGRGPAIWFQQMDSPRPQRNRIHLDIDVPHDAAAARIEAALAAGGTLLSDHAAPAFWVLADAEGNEACICTWQGRD